MMIRFGGLLNRTAFLMEELPCFFSSNRWIVIS